MRAAMLPAASETLEGLESSSMPESTFTERRTFSASSLAST